jgi:hypothetical protein
MKNMMKNREHSPEKAFTYIMNRLTIEGSTN